MPVTFSTHCSVHTDCPVGKTRIRLGRRLSVLHVYCDRQIFIALPTVDLLGQDAAVVLF